MVLIKSKLIRKIAIIQSIAFLLSTLVVIFVLSLLHVPMLFGAFGLMAVGMLSLVATLILFGKSVSKRSSGIQREAGHLAPSASHTALLGQTDDELDALESRMKMMAKAVRDQFHAAEDEKERNALILQTMNEGVLALDHDCQILFANPAAEKIFEVAHGAVSKSLIEISRNHKLDSLMRRAIRERKQLTDEMTWGYDQEKILKIQAIGVTQENSIICGILVLTDVTEIRRLEGMRREFVANVSHELR